MVASHLKETVVHEPKLRHLPSLPNLQAVVYTTTHNPAQPSLCYTALHWAAQLCVSSRKA